MNLGIDIDPGYIGTYQGERGEPNLFFNTMGRKTYAIKKFAIPDGRYALDDVVKEVRIESGVAEADVISSELGNGLHAPVIDIDVPLRAIPSTTPDHWHLYIEKPMTWRQYKRLLRALVRAGLVERGYCQVSKARGGTHVRLPWVKKVVS